jgi:hypothetical protein
MPQKKFTFHSKHIPLFNYLIIVLQCKVYPIRIFGEHTTQENIDFLCNFIGSIDEYGYLESDSFEQRRRNIEEEYAKATVRESVCAGGAYPSSEQELRQYLDMLMAECDVMPGNASGIIVPHI